jgi:hypothetical protein
VWVGKLALPQALHNDAADAALLEPDYLRAADVTFSGR